jgi:hypothetical protein
MIQFECPCSCGSVFFLPDEYQGRPWCCPYSAARRKQVDGHVVQEADWLAWSDPREFLLLSRSTTVRKRRLLCAAFCRLRDRLASHAALAAAVETVERHADGQAPQKEVRALSQYLKQHGPALRSRGWKQVVNYLDTGKGNADFKPYFTTEEEKQSHSHLLRDLFGNLFYQVAAATNWLAWDGGAVPALAQAIYDERAFDRLPVLADALEEAGCDHAGLLSHCRARGVHVRGCWVVDVLLGKE